MTSFSSSRVSLYYSRVSLYYSRVDLYYSRVSLYYSRVILYDFRANLYYYSNLYEELLQLQNESPKHYSLVSIHELQLFLGLKVFNFSNFRF
jgi:hypothetical protein